MLPASDTSAFRMVFGEFLRSRRESEEITETKFARILGESRQFINGIEGRKGSLYLGSCQLLCCNFTWSEKTKVGTADFSRGGKFQNSKPVPLMTKILLQFPYFHQIVHYFFEVSQKQ